MKYILKALDDGTTLICKMSDRYYVRDTAITAVKLKAEIDLNKAYFAFKEDPSTYAQMILDEAISEHKHWFNYSEDKAGNVTDLNGKNLTDANEQ